MKCFVKNLAAAVILAAGLLPTRINAAVWVAENEWSADWEARYVEWVRTDFNKDIFHNPEDKAIFGLALDCSDAIYAMRVLFAYQNKLPFVINDPTNGRTLSNEISKWDGFRESRRHENDDGTWKTYKGPEYTEADKLRAFIDYIGDVTSTLNLVNDTYPIALGDVRPGDMFLLPRNHAYIIRDVEPTGAMTTLSHSSPRAWRVMAEINDFPAEVPEDARKRDGYRRFKPAAYLRKNPVNVPGASTEQWQIAANLNNDIEAFKLMTQTALAKIEEPMSSKAERLFTSLCDYTVQRVDIVNHAQNQLQHISANAGRQCMTFNEYAEFSTPGLDKKLTGYFRLLRAMTQTPEWVQEDFALKPVIDAVFASTDTMSEQEIGEYCPVPFDIQGGRNISLREVWRGIDSGRLVSDPHAPPDMRWGLSREKWTPQCESAKRG